MIHLEINNFNHMKKSFSIAMNMVGICCCIFIKHVEDDTMLFK